MSIPKTEIPQSEQLDENERRHSDATTEDAAVDTTQTTPAQEAQDEFDDPTESVRNDPQHNRKGEHVETP